jgi:hypothetical protein
MAIVLSRTEAKFAQRKVAVEVRPDDHAFPVLAGTRERAAAHAALPRPHTVSSRVRAACLALM